MANALGQAWSALMALAFVPLYVRWLGIEAYGLIGLYAVLWAWLTLLNLGMTPTLNREMARFTAGAHTPQSIRDLLRSLELACLVLALVAALAVWGSSGWIAHHWVEPQELSRQAVADAIAVMSLLVGLRFCEGIYHGALLGLQRQVWLNVVAAALATLRHAGALGVLVWIEPSLRAFFLWQAAISLLSLAVLAAGVYAALPRAAARFSRQALAQVWRFSGGMVVIGVLALLLTQVDKMLLSKLLPLQAFGYYALAAAVSAALLMIVGPIVRAVYPRMVELAARNDTSALADVYHHGAQMITVATAPAMLVLCVFAREVMAVWSGDDQLAANVAPILSTLAIGSFLNGMMWLPYHGQLAHGWTRLAIAVNTVAVTLLVPTIFWVVPRHGAVGAAWVWVALNAGYVLITIQLMHRRILRGEKWRWYHADLAWPLAGAAAIVLAASALRPEPEAGRGLWIAFLLGTGALSVAGAALAADRIRPRLLTRRS